MDIHTDCEKEIVGRINKLWAETNVTVARQRTDTNGARTRRGFESITDSRDQ